MKKRLALLGTLLLCVTAASNVSASLWTIQATSVNSDWSDFTLTVNDVNGDSTFTCCTSGVPSSPDSIVSFSGVTWVTHPTTPPKFYSTLDYTPDLVIGGLTLAGDPTKWGFSAVVGSAGKTASQWTYTATVVPIPAAAWLFGSGLLGLVGIARRKKA